MKIFPIVKKVIGGGAGFIASVIKAGVALSNRFTLSPATEAIAGVAIDATRQTGRIDQSPAFTATLLGATGTAATPEHTPGIDVDASLRDIDATSTQQSPAVSVAASLTSVAATSTQQTPAVDTELLGVTGTLVQQQAAPAVACSARISEYHLDATPAAEIVRVTYDLTRRVGANAQAAVGTAWTNPGNATGTNDGAVATSAGGALAATRGIELSYADSVSKGDLTITDARLFVYASVTGDVTGLLTDTTISYNIGAGLVDLEIVEGNFDNLTTPREYNLTGILDTWTEYDALQTRVVVAHAALSAGITASLDAIEVRIIATRTDNL